MSLQRLSDNAHEIGHRGREYTLIKRSRDRGYDMYIDGRGPHHFRNLYNLVADYPHLGQDVALIGITS